MFVPEPGWGRRGVPASSPAVSTSAAAGTMEASPPHPPLTRSPSPRPPASAVNRAQAAAQLCSRATLLSASSQISTEKGSLAPNGACREEGRGRAALAAADAAPRREDHGRVHCLLPAPAGHIPQWCYCRYIRLSKIQSHD